MEPKQTNKTISSARPIDSDQLLTLIQADATKRVLLIAGMPIDGDSLASALAMHAVLKKLGRESDVACGAPVPQGLLFIEGASEVIHQPDFLHYDLVCIFDCGELQLTGYADQLNKLLSVSGLARVVNIDHHLQEPVYGHFALLDHRAAATGMIIYNAVKRWEAALGRELLNVRIASALLATLYYDTGSFQHNNVTASVLRMAAECVRLGADAASIASELYRNKSVKVFRLWGRALRNLQFHPSTGMVVSVITQRDLHELGVTREEAKGIVEILSHVPECTFALLLTEETDNTIKGSMRANESKNTNVARIARVLGGGGHRLAAGFKLAGKIEHDGSSYRVV